MHKSILVDKSDAEEKKYINEMSGQVLFWSIYNTFICLVFLSLLPYLHIQRFITKPIKALLPTWQKKISTGDLSGDKIAATTNDELGKNDKQL